MAPHSSTLAWKNPWTEKPGRLQSMGSQRVRRDWATSLSLFNRGIDKDVWYLYSRKDYSVIKTSDIMSFAATWMNLESLTLKEISHTKGRNIVWHLSQVASTKKCSVQFSSLTQLCLTLCDPMDCSLSRSSIHGFFQARVLEWVAISYSRRSFQSRDWTRVFRMVGRRFTVWAPWEAPLYPIKSKIFVIWGFTGNIHQFLL